jgi:PBSX family phage terminase large subunit
MSESSKQLSTIVDGLRPIDIRAELFRKGDFDFVVKGKNDAGEDVEHHKMREVLQALWSNQYEEILAGGSAGNGKSWAGCVWLLFMCINYPGTRWFVSRNELKDIVDSVLVTWSKVCRYYGFTDWKYNAVKSFIQIGNTSHINFIELKYKPSDPMYEDLGSTEYTGGWAEELSEQNEMGINVISSRVGRHLNSKYKVKGTILMTTNPKKNWVKTRFYDPWKRGTLPSNLCYVPSLVTDNPFIEPEYVDKLRRMGEKNKQLYERLFKGNWDYEENPNALCDYQMIEQIFDNDHVGNEKDIHYITADIARMGSDKAVILVWKGWRVIDIKTYDTSATTEISYTINLFRRKYQIPKNHIVVDADGIGGSIVDETGALPFINNASAIKENGDMPNYRNLQVQCLYHLADKINEGGLWIDCDLTPDNKEEIRAELDQIQSRLSDYGKLDCKPKSEIKQDIGRSPDYRDALFMRVYFDIFHTSPLIYTTKKTLAELGINW